MNNKSIRF